jgi:hypothetical protein
MSPAGIRESLQTITVYFERFENNENPEEQLVLREILVGSVQQFLKGLQEKA